MKEPNEMEGEHEVRNMVIVGIVLLGIVIGARYLWAKAVYQDTRCMWAECRINVNPK
jgi:hypothetical protein